MHLPEQEFLYSLINLIQFLAVPEVISDEEGNDSELDNAVIGCLGFLPLSGAEAPTKPLPSESERTPSKTDIAAASPGAVGTDPESQSEFRKERAEAEKLREKEKLDINHMQKQYMRMRKLQKKNMLVFNSFANQSTRPKNEVRSKAINHLFIDLPSFERKTQRHTRYPFVTPTANGKNVRRMDNAARGASGEISGKLTVKNNLSTRDVFKTTIQNAENEYSSNEDQLERGNGKKKMTTQRNTQKNTQNDTRKDKEHTVTESILYSTNFKVDKNALYPANFKPFPQRAQTPKSKFFISNQLGNSSNKSKQIKTTNALSNSSVR